MASQWQGKDCPVPSTADIAPERPGGPVCELCVGKWEHRFRSTSALDFILGATWEEIRAFVERLI